MKILIVTETLNNGGSEIFVLRLARALIRSGIVAQVISLNKRYESREMTSLYKDVPVKRLSLPVLPAIEFIDRMLARMNFDFSLKYFLQGWQLKRQIRDYDIVHSHYIQVDYLLCLLRRALPFKLLVTVHGDYSAQYDSFRKGNLRFWLRLDKKLLLLQKEVDKWVILSEEQRQFFKNVMKVPDDNVIQIYNGYEKPHTTGRRKYDSIFTIGMVSRGHENKGWEILIGAFQKLNFNTRLILVGGGDYMEHLKEKYKGDSKITFTGFSSKPEYWLQLMDVFVLPTRFEFESLPTVITEALSFGIPVIATDVGEIKKMITDAETLKEAGLLLPFSDVDITKELLAEKLLYLYQNREKLSEMKITAMEAYKKFNMAECVESYSKIYQQLSRQ